jgi:hypothetical protein
MAASRLTDAHRRELRGLYSDIAAWPDRGMTKRAIAATVLALLNELDFAWQEFDGLADGVMELLALDAQKPPKTEDEATRRRTTRGKLAADLMRRIREPATSSNGRISPDADTEMPPCTADAGGERCRS